MTKYTVIQQHFGDKQYYENDVRIVENAQDAEQLINMGLIKPLDEQANDEKTSDEKQSEDEKTSDEKQSEDEKTSTKKAAKKGDEP